MKKKIIAVVLSLSVLIFSLSACTKLVDETKENTSIYASFYPIYALAEMMMQDIPNMELHCLIQPQDGCLRSYTMSDWDLYLLNYSADCLLMGGSGLESFHDIVSQFSEIPIAELFYGLDMYEGSLNSTAEDSHFEGPNPHLYLGTEGALKILESLMGTLSVLDPKYSDQYEANYQSACEQMETLKAEIQEITSACIGKKAAVMNETLIYPAQEYKMEVVCWIERESGEAFYGDDLKDCIDQLKEAETEVVLIEQQAPEAFVAAIEEAGFKVVRLNVLSTMQEKDGAQGYINALRSNAEAAARVCLS